jgi:hypothetical protein
MGKKFQAAQLTHEILLNLMRKLYEIFKVLKSQKRIQRILA